MLPPIEAFDALKVAGVNEELRRTRTGISRVALDGHFWIAPRVKRVYQPSPAPEFESQNFSRPPEEAQRTVIQCDMHGTGGAVRNLIVKRDHQNCGFSAPLLSCAQDLLAMFSAERIAKNNEMERLLG
jgi:hypothetical protein